MLTPSQKSTLWHTLTTLPDGGEMVIPNEDHLAAIKTIMDKRLLWDYKEKNEKGEMVAGKKDCSITPDGKRVRVVW